MVFDFLKKRSEEGLDQLNNLAGAAYKGKLGEGLKDLVDYTATTNAAFANGLAKSRDRLKQNLELLLTGSSDDVMEDLLDILLQADLGMVTSEDVVQEVKSLQASGQRFLNRDELMSVLRGKLIEALETGKPGAVQFSESSNMPTVLFIMGANGMGKTTTIGKLAYRLRTEGNQTVLMAACDTFRAGAVEQLEQWADRAEVDCFGPSEVAKTPAAVLYGALDMAIKNKYDTLLVDTSGRLSNNDALTAELAKMKRVIQKRMSAESDADGKPILNTAVPHETLLVIDAAQGRMALDSAKVWDTEIGLTGLILTKLDGSARGGSVVAVSRELDVPVKLIGVGEGIEDLRDFSSDTFVDGLLGIGKAFGGKSNDEAEKLEARLLTMRKERDSQSKTKILKAVSSNPTPTLSSEAGNLTFEPMNEMTPITEFQRSGGGRPGMGANSSKKKRKKKKRKK
eukprot:CAMPEP_0194199190 /NCGR_PEP_ID=MMETSP0156-20130528/296_1 /TAXON_ID=33649 /ORGANISM="Thalassionema nitzschioides, Strain L26-B" /LENGTH=453 /DNA_ID=CAMNT_0038924047 /DNA_START=272 /DNA_END=1633 /DNA_ORIENTATION=+